MPVLCGHTHGGESMEATWNDPLRLAGRAQREQALPVDEETAQPGI
jgi:hypothetical protein